MDSAVFCYGLRKNLRERFSRVARRDGLPNPLRCSSVAQVDELETFVSKKKQNLVMDSGK
jgi:hypothetical protein